MPVGQIGQAPQQHRGFSPQLQCSKENPHHVMNVYKKMVGRIQDRKPKVGKVLYMTQRCPSHTKACLVARPGDEDAL